ncbi:protocatechuate 3,4-dioxygenase subunit alpha [Roseomonas chloroacetimidivorans]|uniref:protocatechuate 3,4-dioxygenase subunit alpha n=1 Tax=Roseomonas chloroacetimidivorans TaxID=1766656 RepID=UPI003C71CDD8
MSRPNEFLPPTGWHTIGPFFPRTFFKKGDNDLTRLSPDAAPTACGERILLHGRVLEQGGGPCVNAVLEVWQADAGGRFRHPLDPAHAQADPDFLGWGRAWTDEAGHYEFHTVMPGGYADAAGPRAPHVNLAVLGSGIMRRLVTTVFFPDFAVANSQDPILLALPEDGLRRRLVATEDGTADHIRRFRFDLVLHGSPEEETPFFVD